VQNGDNKMTELMQKYITRHDAKMKVNYNYYCIFIS